MTSPEDQAPATVELPDPLPETPHERVVIPLAFEAKRRAVLDVLRQHDGAEIVVVTRRRRARRKGDPRGPADVGDPVRFRFRRWGFDVRYGRGKKREDGTFAGRRLESPELSGSTGVIDLDRDGGAGAPRMVNLDAVEQIVVEEDLIAYDFTPGDAVDVTDLATGEVYERRPIDFDVVDALVDGYATKAAADWAMADAFENQPAPRDRESIYPRPPRRERL